MDQPGFAMSYERLLVYGASGHGKVVADVVQRAGLPYLEGFIDDGVEPGTLILDLPVKGGEEWLRQQAEAGAVAVALGIGINRTRQRVARRCREMGVALVTACHPAAAIAPSARLGEGTVVMAGAAINPDARLGPGVIINTGAVVEHDVVIGEFAHLSPNAATGGGVRLGALSHLGLGAVVLPLVSVGQGTVVGAGAAVIQDLPDNVVAVGLPAKPLSR